MDKIIGFHKPTEPYGFLSNWYDSTFTVDNHLFYNMEQYFMWSKAMLFNDKEIAEKVLSITDCAEIKALGRVVKNFDGAVWDANKYRLIKRGIFEKFNQNEYLKDALLKTGDAILVECAVNDKIWAIGISLYDNRRFDMSQWKGQNLLGKALMDVREDLRNR